MRKKFDCNERKYFFCSRKISLKKFPSPSNKYNKYEIAKSLIK